MIVLWLLFSCCRVGPNFYSYSSHKTSVTLLFQTGIHFITFKDPLPYQVVSLLLKLFITVWTFTSFCALQSGILATLPWSLLRKRQLSVLGSVLSFCLVSSIIKWTKFLCVALYAKLIRIKWSTPKKIFFSPSFGVIAKKFSKLSSILSTIFVNFCAKLKRFGSF